LPEGTDQRDTGDAAAELERLIREQHGVVSVHRFVGATGPGFYYNLPNATQAPNRARLVVNLERMSDTAPLISWVREHVAVALPELEISAATLAQGPPRAAPVEVRVFHASDSQRLAAAEQIFAALKATPGAVDVRHDIDLGTPVLRLVVDDASAARHGLSRNDVAQ